MARKKIVGSEQQKEIWDAMTMRKENLLVTARAGTGKTTSMEEGLWQMRIGLKDRIASVAFGRDAAADLKKRVPPMVQAMTLHGLGYRAIARGFSLPSNELFKEHKVGRILREIDFKAGKAFFSFLKIVDLVKCYFPKTHITLQELEGVVVKHNVTGKIWDLFSIPEILKPLNQVLEHSTAVEKYGIDYSDMVWVPTVVKKVKKELIKYDLLVVDELQDLNLVQRDIVENSHKRLIGVGDEYQSIFGFRGADVDSMNEVRKIMQKSGGLIELPLTVSRRCPQIVVPLVNGIVKDFEVLKTAKAGAATTIDPGEVEASVKPGDTILCRLNAPLVSVFYSLIVKGKKAYIRGRNIGRDLMNMLEELKFSDNENPTGKTLLDRLEQFYEKELYRMLNAGAKGSDIASFEDKIDCLRSILRNNAAKTLEDIDKHLNDIFQDHKIASKTVTLSSIHKAKGLEYENVFILAPELIPFEKAVEPWEKQQELNLAYVAATRVKNTLYGVGGFPLVLGSVERGNESESKCDAAKPIDLQTKVRTVRKARRV